MRKRQSGNHHDSEKLRIKHVVDECICKHKSLFSLVRIPRWDTEVISFASLKTVYFRDRICNTWRDRTFDNLFLMNCFFVNQKAQFKSLEAYFNTRIFT